MSAEITEISSPVENKIQFPNVSDLTRCFYLSFKYSQGNDLLQRECFKYLKLKNPEWCFLDSTYVQVLERVLPAVEAILPNVNLSIEGIVSNENNSVRHPDVKQGTHLTDYLTELRKQLRYMQHNLNRPDDSSEEEIISYISTCIIDLDYMYLVNNKGRKRDLTENAYPKNPNMNPFLSHFIYYGLEGNKTGNCNFDSMFSDVSNYFRANQDMFDINRFEEVRTVYELHRLN